MNKLFSLLLILITINCNPIEACVKLSPNPQKVITNEDSLIFSGLFRTYGMDEIKPNILKTLIENVNDKPKKHQ